MSKEAKLDYSWGRRGNNRSTEKWTVEQSAGAAEVLQLDEIEGKEIDSPRA